MLQRRQMLALPASGFLMGLLIALLYAPALGSTMAWAVGATLALVLGMTGAWVAYRSDGAARHTVGNSLLYGLSAAPFLGGACLVLAQMAGLDSWRIPAWMAGVATVVVPVLGSAWLTRARLDGEGATGPWARAHLDLRASVLSPDALAAAAQKRPALTPWLVGALGVNLPLAWRVLGGGQAGLLVLGLALLVAGVVWGGVAQVGPALGAAWHVLDIERRTGQRLRHPQWAEMQAVRRAHWLARWLMREP